MAHYSISETLVRKSVNIRNEIKPVNVLLRWYHL